MHCGKPLPFNAYLLERQRQWRQRQWWQLHALDVVVCNDLVQHKFMAGAPSLVIPSCPASFQGTFSGLFFLQCCTFYMPQKMTMLLLMLNLRRRQKHLCLTCGPIFQRKQKNCQKCHSCSSAGVHGGIQCFLFAPLLQDGRRYTQGGVL